MVIDFIDKSNTVLGNHFHKVLVIDYFISIYLLRHYLKVEFKLKKKKKSVNDKLSRYSY